MGSANKVEERSRDSRPIVRATVIACALSMILLRVAWLNSDAYPRLSWSSALLTDEGFYIHNARNIVLFGHERLDEWNNALIMPLLHLVQVVVFRIFGVGAVQARSISVICGLLSIIVLRDALLRCCSRMAANISALFLGLDHFYLLYNRLALMDTPCALFMVTGLWAAIRGAESAHADKSTRRPGRFLNSTERWFCISGMIFGAAYAVRGMAALIWWLPFLLCLTGVTQRADKLRNPAVIRNLLATAGGLIGTMLLYVVFWWQPHHAELAYVNHYYIDHQLIPHSLHRLGENINISLTDWQRGLFPFLLRHTPVQFVLASGMAASLLLSLARKSFLVSDTRDALLQHIGLALAGWLLIFWVFCCSVNYSPSRYYVLFYPAMSALAALALAEMACARSGRVMAAVLLTCWAILNSYWLRDWMTHLTYRQHSADRWLATHLPTNSVLLGAVAPGLCMDNRFRAVNMMKDLCNDHEPVEKVGNAPAYIVMLDTGNWKEVWWEEHYPSLVDPDRRLHAFPRLLRPFFVIGLYPANERSLREFKEMQVKLRGK
jgi:4-amino-4-deoxy-L-arabinose transferase-like glycosyltransferase